MFIYRGVFSAISCIQYFPTNSQYWLLIKFNFVSQNIIILDTCGYITIITAAKLLGNNISCFDASIQSEDGTH